MAKKKKKKMCIWCEQEEATDLGNLCATCVGECIHEYEENHDVCESCWKPDTFCECEENDC